MKQKYYQRKYIPIDNFFSKWSSDMAYCLGFITADGHVWKDKPYITIGISKKDQQILEYLRDCISPLSRIRESNNNVKILITSHQIKKDLNKYNVNHQKTFNLKVDFRIPNKYWGDYLRGFFDGDGSIYSTIMRGKQYYYSSFSCASKPMLEYIKNRLKMGNIRCLRDKYYELKFSQGDSLKLFDVLYKNKNGFKLERKYNKFFEINTNYHFWTSEEDQIILDHIKDRSTKILHKLLPNRTPSSIQTRKNRLRKCSLKK